MTIAAELLAILPPRPQYAATNKAKAQIAEMHPSRRETLDLLIEHGGWMTISEIAKLRHVSKGAQNFVMRRLVSAGLAQLTKTTPTTYKSTGAVEALPTGQQLRKLNKPTLDAREEAIEVLARLGGWVSSSTVATARGKSATSQYTVLGRLVDAGLAEVKPGYPKLYRIKQD